MSCYSIFGKGIVGDYSQWKARPWSVEARSTQGVENEVSGAPISQSPPNQNPLLVSGKQREKGTLQWPHVEAWGPEASGHRRAWWASETNSLAAQGLLAAASSLFGSTPSPEIWTERQALLPSRRWLKEVRTGCLLPLSQDTTAHCTQRVPQLPRDTRVRSPCSLSNWEWTGEGGPAVLRAQHCGYTSPHLLNNFQSLILSKCHMHWIYQFSIRLKT